MIVPLLLNVANTIYFVSVLPQIWTAYKFRRGLNGLSIHKLGLNCTACLLFFVVNLLLGAYIGAFFNMAVLFSEAVQFFWKWRYKEPEPKECDWP
jgi:hypothetical protein